MMLALWGAFARLTGRLFLGQWAGNFLLMLLAAGWLQIANSHTWQSSFSILSGLVLVAIFLCLYVVTFRHLLPCAGRPPWWRSCVFLLLWVALWWLGLQPIGVARAHESLFAGYWNSQSSLWLRHHFGYSSLVAWQERIYDGIEWLWAAFLLPVAIETCACGRFSRASRAYRDWFYWICVLICGLAASTQTWALADWTPDAGLLGETISSVARLGTAYTIDILLWCFLLALVAHYLAGGDKVA